MRAKKKPVRVLAHHERAKTGAQDRTGQGFHSDDTISRGAGQATIAALLSCGQENAVPMADLRAMTGLDGRMIRAMIQRERLAGVPICADNHSGYFLPADERERLDCAKSMKHRAGEIMKVAESIEEAT